MNTSTTIQKTILSSNGSQDVTEFVQSAKEDMNGVMKLRPVIESIIFGDIQNLIVQNHLLSEALGNLQVARALNLQVLSLPAANRQVLNHQAANHQV